MRSMLALLRATWLSATSYRLATILSFVSLLASVVPVYFIAKAVEPLAQESIRLEGTDYFGFVVIGIAATYILLAATSVLPSVLAGSIGSGTFEAMLVTRTSLPVLLLGLSAYPLLSSLLNAALVVGGAMVLGVRLELTMVPAVAVIGALLMAAYGAIGLVSAALILVFRTSGPLVTAVVAGSSLLGGVYYSTTAIPGWLQSLSAFVPLTYALRATRRLLLAGAPLREVAGDVTVLALLAVAGLAIGATAFNFAMRHARRAGTLSQY
jgi:ABC-2 type transport system permease protein